MKLAVVIPVYNEAALLPRLFGRVMGVAPPDGPGGKPCERVVVLVDDGSSDATVRKIKKLADETVTVIGVMPPEFDTGAALWRAADPSWYSQNNATFLNARYLNAVGLLAEGMDSTRAANELDALSAQIRDTHGLPDSSWRMRSISLIVAMDERRFLEMNDGVRIALTLHFPDTPPPWPVIFEARPYRKDDLSDATAIYRRLCDEGDLAVARSWRTPIAVTAAVVSMAAAVLIWRLRPRTQA